MMHEWGLAKQVKSDVYIALSAHSRQAPPTLELVVHDSTLGNIMNWDDLRYFLAVARTQSLTESSIRLQVSQATVARRIASLEESLDTRLFSRGIDGYRLTEAGAALLEPAEQAEAQMLWIERVATAPAQSLRGTIRLGMPELLGQHVIIPKLAHFLEDHPGIQLELIADVRSVRLSKGEADVLVRLSRPAHGNYVMRRAGALALGLYCSPAYAASYLKRKSGNDAAFHRVIGWEPTLAYLPMARWLKEQMISGDYVVRSHTLGSQLAAVQAGIGIAVLPAIVAKQYGLIQAMGDHPPLISDIWILQQHDSHKLERVRALVDFLSTIFVSLEDELVTMQ
ncbi:LysR family transcriptional regulator [Agrobacterium tumefaciens]|uniref:LysR family transcriptional regulator n=1 Tax=Agrobacterium tumefaciens TaxID=358 RepID=UPI001572B0AB|nr:LysR family transcriptional regulator [Agrobacterium tumefaciens]NTB99204.1 LysR family transcriptional regulator [Agrobacterium tumefaciens]NTC44503.1 LysR family transcriptional regulator [Agrobacterium tumefaciens]